MFFKVEAPVIEHLKAFFSNISYHVFILRPIFFWIKSSDALIIAENISEVR